MHTLNCIVCGVLCKPLWYTSKSSKPHEISSSLSSTTAMLASVTGVSITVLAVVTPPINLRR